MLAMLLKARQPGLPMIQSQVLFTPAADVSGDGGIANDGRDQVDWEVSIRIIRDLNGADPKDPLVSPIHGNYDPY